MARTTWKRAERDAASILHGARYPANQGGAVDVESSRFVAEVKNVKRFSALQIERECLAIERAANLKNKVGVLMVKRSAGKGKDTPWLICMTAAMFRELSLLPAETP